MTIKITQTCDGCGASREINFGFYGQARTLQAAAEQGGWREIRSPQHLCNDGIKNALKGGAS